MQAIILVGGLGTRLQSVVKDVPKPMALINGKPFLAYLVDSLQKQGVTRIILSMHHLHEQIEAYFLTYHQTIQIDYLIESKPLGTGGAVSHAISQMEITDTVFVLNGDTFVKLNYKDMLHAHQKASSSLTLALHGVANCERYGKVSVDGDWVVALQEKGAVGPGYINAGVYLLEPAIFNTISLPEAFSLEKDFLIPHLHALHPLAYSMTDYFIDIGVPEDYLLAQSQLQRMLD
jgi:D-glycero-alpha-D-manno-heptose 1-phosphate guanylyltransferase